ncbi:hypothetical protein BKA62DRAFT_749958 [Auriculariales sp. MPI-PUGE-AT-0066]|nr:hypothetical protein BKA62DRAFT_749958 [Auriculariales sp. MPI-PUGE-AT-0066]
MRVLACVAALTALTRAYSNTYPLVAWSNSKSFSLTTSPSASGFSSANELAKLILDAPGVCDHDAVVVIHWPGLHISDLAALPPANELPSSIVGSPFNSIMPHITEPADEMARLHANLSQHCGSTLSVITGQFVDTDGEVAGVAWDDEAEDALGWSKRAPGRHTLHFTARPIVNHGGSARRSEIEAGATRLARMLPSSSTTLTIILGTRGPKTVRSPGILARYQLLSPGIITALLVVLGVSIPMLYFSITTLNSVQNSVRTEAFKVSQTKKDQ